MAPLLKSNHNRLLLGILTVVALLWCSCDNNSRNKSFKEIYQGKHKGIGVSLIKSKREADSNKIYLRISQEQIPYSVRQYLSFRNEPYLSNSISIFCDTDTINPISTLAERSYEAGKELIYLILFENSIHCNKGQFIVRNFFAIGDTLVINL